MIYEGTEWKEIPNYPMYYASADGRILSMAKGNKPRIMRPMSQNTTGHQYILIKNHSPRKLFVHRAILMAWVGLPKEGQISRHLNDIPTDNRVENLAWGTPQDNVDDKIRNGHLPCGEASGKSKLKNEDVMNIRHRYSEGERSSTLANEYRVSRNCILEIVRGSTWSNLPLVPIKVKHTCARLTPLSDEQRQKAIEGLKRYSATRRKPRIEVLCACGCGKTLITPDNKGRERKYIHGHNNRKEGRYVKN